jgi:hypothetical protein
MTAPEVEPPETTIACLWKGCCARYDKDVKLTARLRQGQAHDRFPELQKNDDSGGWALALAEALRQKFGRDKIFVDVDKIRNFENFETNIFAAIDRSDVFVPVIGRRWLELADEAGQRRLDDPGDYVRREMARALDRGIRVLPVLVEDAMMPTAEQLPQEQRGVRWRPGLRRSFPCARPKARALHPV